MSDTAHGDDSQSSVTKNTLDAVTKASCSVMGKKTGNGKEVIWDTEYAVMGYTISSSGATQQVSVSNFCFKNDKGCLHGI